jgi:GIY-YIG catalytic domain.
VLAYLDTLLLRHDTNIITKWYSKPFANQRILSYHSAHSIKHKIAVLHGLKHRMLGLTHQMHKDEIMSVFKRVTVASGYPLKLINRILYSGAANQIDTSITNSTGKNYYKFPYINIFSKLIANLFKHSSVRLSLTPVVKLQSLYSDVKHKFENSDRSNVIYEIPCTQCDKVYIGTTKNKLRVRLQQHARDCSVKNYIKTNKTALATHFFDMGHKFDFSGAKILDIEQNYYKRMLSESLFINKNAGRVVNFRSDISSLNSIYRYTF